MLFPPTSSFSTFKRRSQNTGKVVRRGGETFLDDRPGSVIRVTAGWTHARTHMHTHGPGTSLPDRCPRHLTPDPEAGRAGINYPPNSSGEEMKAGQGGEAALPKATGHISVPLPCTHARTRVYTHAP